MYIQLDLAKKHLNIEDDFLDDDEYLLSLIEVAESAVRVHINDDFATVAEKNGGVLPPPILQACLLMLGNLYQQREIVGNKSVALPFNYQYLVDLYKNYNN